MLSFISLFIQNAPDGVGEAVNAGTEVATDATTKGPSMWPMLLIIIGFFVLMMFMNKRQQKKQQKMIDSIQEGDSVVTAGGICGKVTGMKDNFFIISIADGVKIKVLKSSVYPTPEDAAQAQQK